MERLPGVSVLDLCTVINQKASKQVVQGAELRARKLAALQQLKQVAEQAPGVTPSGTYNICTLISTHLFLNALQSVLSYNKPSFMYYKVPASKVKVAKMRIKALSLQLNRPQGALSYASRCLQQAS